MDLKKKELKKLLKKYRAGQASKEEVDFLHAYYNLFSAFPNVTEGLSNIESDALKSEIRSKITVDPNENKNKRKGSYLLWTSAAAIFIAVCSILYFYGKPDDHQNQPVAVIHKSKDIGPGGNKAILILADGSTIILDAADNGIVAKQNNTEINKTKNGQLIYKGHSDRSGMQEVLYNTIATPRGGQYQLTLSDGTRVWLNSASTIRFPINFHPNERKVEITGEAYFEVPKQLQRTSATDQHRNIPFIVETKDQTVEVLGTHFNINAYEDEGMLKTTLLEGSVRVSIKSNPGTKTPKSHLLVPGQQSQIKTGESNQEINVIDADTEEAVAWKNGYFKFNRSSIQSVMRQVSRWYNVDVEYRGVIPTDEFVGKIKRSDNVSGVLRVLELSNVNCRIEGKKIIVDN